MVLRQCEINEYITVKLEEIELEDWQDDGGKEYIAGFYTELRTHIYINKKWFNFHEGVYVGDKYEELCRDMQEWYTSDYDCSLLSPDLAFKLLEELIEGGDPLAVKVGDHEILRGLQEGKIDQSYRNLLSRTSFWEVSVFETELEKKILQDLENLVQKEFMVFSSYHSRTPRKPHEPCVGFAVKKNQVVALLLEDCGLDEVPEDITKLKHLEGLSLANNRIKKLPDSFNNLKNLLDLSLSNNELQEFPHVLLNMLSLRELWISGNELSKIPNSIIKLQHLYDFSYGTKSKKFPEALCYMKYLSINILTPVEILPPSIEFYLTGKLKRGRDLAGNGLRPVLNGWWEYFKLTKKLCGKCQKEYHTDNFPMCYDCLLKFESKYRDNPLEYTKNLKSFNYTEWKKKSENQEKLKERINESINNGGIFSYPEEVQSLVKKFKKKGYTFKDFKDPKFLPLFRRAIFDTHDKYLLVAYEDVRKRFTSPDSVEERLRKYFNRCIDLNTGDGTFFQEKYMEEMKTKIAQKFLPDLTETLQRWFEKYTLKRKLKKHPPNLDQAFIGSWRIEEWREGSYDAHYGDIDNFIVVLCNFHYFRRTLRSGSGFGSFSDPNKIISTEVEYEADLSLFFLQNMLFISDIDLKEDLSKEQKEKLIQKEVNDLLELINKYWKYHGEVGQPVPDYASYVMPRFLNIDDLPDRSFIRILLFEDHYQKEFLYSFIRQYDFLNFSLSNYIRLKEEIRKPIDNLVPSKTKVIKQLQADLRFDF